MGLFLPHSFVLFVLVQVHISVELFLDSCPAKPMWNLRGKNLCGEKDKYMCLYDRNKRKFRELCKDKPEFHRSGYIFVISGNLQYFDGRPCKSNKYQPHIWWTNGSSGCQYLKSICNGEGQVPYDNGNITSDRKCRCDYTHYYTFLNSTRHRCYCDPEEEDCSCYRKKCDVDEVLTPDYDCVGTHEWTGQFVCPEYKPSKIPDEGEAGTATCPTIRKDSSGTRQQSFYLANTVIFIVIVILGLMITTVFFFQNSSQKRSEKMKELTTILVKEIIKSKIPERDPGANIVNNTIQQMENHRKDDSYFMTSTVQVALEILKSFNTLIIVGLEGSGKSSLCFEIATHYQDNGFTVLVIPPSDIKNTIHYIRPDKNHLYIFDVNFEKDQDGTIFKTCKDYCQNAKMKFIITISSYYHTSELSLDLFEDQKQYIRLDSSCKEDKFGILKTHMTKNKVTICDNSYESNYEDPDVIQNYEKPVRMYKKVLDKIIDTHAFTGFPIACKKFFSDRSLLHLEHRYFNSPPYYVIYEINSLRNKKEVIDKLKYAVLVYIMINERASVTDIQEDKNLFPAVCKSIDASSWQSFQIKDALEDLKGTVLKCVRNIFEFTHVIMSKAVWMSYIDIDAQLCVSTCKWSYIEDYIRPQTWPVHEYDVCVRVHKFLIITRLVTELSGGSSWSVGQYLLKCYQSCFQFINDFCQHYMEKENVKIDVLLTLCSAFSKVGTSFEVFKKSKVTKEMLLSCNVDQFGNCMMHYCVLQDYEGMLSGIPDNDKDMIINVFNKRGHSPCHLEFYFGRKGMVEKHICCIPRTYEYYSKLNKLYHVGERNFGRIIETKHLNVIGQMDLHIDILQRAKFGSKQDFKSVKDKLLTLKKETMKMVRIKKISSSVEDTVVANVLATYKCEIIKQYRERHRQKRRITNIETGDRIVICKPFKNPLPRLIEIGHVEVEVEVCLD